MEERQTRKRPLIWLLQGLALPAALTLVVFMTAMVTSLCTDAAADIHAHIAVGWSFVRLGYIASGGISVIVLAAQLGTLRGLMRLLGGIAGFAAIGWAVFTLDV